MRPTATPPPSAPEPQDRAARPQLSTADGEDARLGSLSVRYTLALLAALDALLWFIFPVLSLILLGLAAFLLAFAHIQAKSWGLTWCCVARRRVTMGLVVLLGSVWGLIALLFLGLLLAD
ncbi:MAG: hypothetical protein GXO54_06345 [Chloroflexi bacterium]|nr:hypothetical protein [Chloroflexota bacterium]